MLLLRNKKNNFHLGAVTCDFLICGVRSQWVLVHMSQGDDGGGDSTNIVIISLLHLIKKKLY